MVKGGTVSVKINDKSGPSLVTRGLDRVTHYHQLHSILPLTA
jgi:hypothetical protein